MNNKEVAHLWANRSRESAKGSSFYFTGDTIYSYGAHFPIARHYKGCVLFTCKGYSNTTAKHKGYARSAVSHLTVFTVSDVSRDPCREDVSGYAAEIKSAALAAGRARNSEAALGVLQRLVDEANSFCARFGFKTRFAMPDNLEELRAKAKASAERERKAKLAKQARQERETQKTIRGWLAGESVSIPHFIDKVYLRVHPLPSDRQMASDIIQMETSKGARIPLSEAKRTFSFIVKMRERGWRRNGETFQVGEYHLDAVNEQGVVAGCHRITWDEIERFAKTQGWL